jgi:hypothetical protein
MRKERVTNMGDRRLAEIRTSGGSIYFYTHSTGNMMPSDAEAALKMAEPLMNDEPCALRRIIDYLIRVSGSRDNELGSGIMLYPIAEDYYGGDPASVIIDLVNWRVSANTRS